MTRRYVVSFVMAFLALLSSSPAFAAETLTMWIQQQDLYDQVKWMAGEYEQQHPGVAIDIQFVSAFGVCPAGFGALAGAW